MKYILQDDVCNHGKLQLQIYAPGYSRLASGRIWKYTLQIAVLESECILEWIENNEDLDYYIDKSQRKFPYFTRQALSHLVYYFSKKKMNVKHFVLRPREKLLHLYESLGFRFIDTSHMTCEVSQFDPYELEIKSRSNVEKEIARSQEIEN